MSANPGTMPASEASDAARVESVSRWMKAQGLSGEPIRLLPDVGFVNWVYQLGDDLILRVTKSGGDSCDAYTESVAVPAVVSAGLMTPKLLVFDDSRRVVSTVVTLYEKAPGVTLGRQRVDQRELPALYRQLGEQLGILHDRVKSCDDPDGYLDKPEMYEAREYLDEARRKRKVEAVSYDWLLGWLDRLEPGLDRVPEPVFLHNDLHSFNTMIDLDPLALTAVIDWGDAGWGDPAIEFGFMPIWAVDWMLQGYERIRLVDDGFFARLLWNDIGAALEASIKPWVETDEPWQPLTSSRWINLIRFAAEPGGRRWARWMPASSI